MFQRWTRIDRNDATTWPPLKEPILFIVQATGTRWWHTFFDEANLEHVMLNSDYDYWREEMTVDSP